MEQKLLKVVIAAIEQVGVSEFKKTSMFASNERVQSERKQAA